MFHCKLLVVDEYLVSVGSTNFDSRSFKLNDEANLNIYDREFARQQTRDLRGGYRESRSSVTLEEWLHRPLDGEADRKGRAVAGLAALDNSIRMIMRSPS